jgi:hypothetical protein
MNYKFINALLFAAGAAIGSVVTWKIVKSRYERIAQEEIDSVKAAFNDRLAELQDDDDETGPEDESDERQECAGQINWDELEDLEEDDEGPDEDLREYARIVERYSDREKFESDIKKKGGADNMAREPYVISPYDFGELDGYKQFELTYYADNILEDEDYNIVTDADELIGPDALMTFGEYEDDAVFVRNERLRADFQILKDYRTYDEARTIGPGQVDDE